MRHKLGLRFFGQFASYLRELLPVMFYKIQRSLNIFSSNYREMAIWAFPSSELISSGMREKCPLGESITNYTCRINKPLWFFFQDSQPVL
jgi:hypothetical protein